MTDPWVVTIRAPIRTIVIINGANQYFLRTFRKSQMSFTSSRNASMVQKASEIRAMVLAVFSVSSLSFSPSSQWIISSQAHDKGYWLKNKDEDQTQDNVTIDPS